MWSENILINLFQRKKTKAEVPVEIGDVGGGGGGHGETGRGEAQAGPLSAGGDEKALRM